jgi:pyridine nucleotide-disulfide oxidoreductase family protein
MAKKLLLIGGGHAQLFVLEALRQRREALADLLDVTLVSREVLTTYSGMLPGLVAGHYRTRACQIDLRPLAAEAGVKLVHDRIGHLDLDAQIAFGDSGEWQFDMTSIDIGSSLDLSTVPGAEIHAVGVRPVDEFLERWRTLLDRVGEVMRPLHGIVVGGGAGGVELVLAMAHRLAPCRDIIKWSLVTRGPLLPGYSAATVRRVTRHFAKAGIALRTDADVVRVDDGSLILGGGSTAAFDALVWATGASAQAWPAAAGLASVDNGFIEINDFLQSVSHPNVFAAGDIATNPKQRRPKAGVYAVRQGPVLAENLLRHASGQPLQRYRPQSDYLSLLATGDRHAVASWYGLAWEGDWVWRWKNKIDQQFMQRFSPPFDIR